MRTATQSINAQEIYVVARLRMLLRHTIKNFSHPSAHAVEGSGLRLLAVWHCGFESRLGYGCLFLVRDECCKAEVSATGPSL